MNPVDVLLKGARELEPVLGPHGFEFVQTDSGRSSGGHFASGEYRRGDRRLELHVRWSLGLVTYHVGQNSLSHEQLTRAVRATLGIGEPARYPGFSDDPLDGFRHLEVDLRHLGRVFTSGAAEEFAALVDWVGRNPRPAGLAALP